MGNIPSQNQHREILSPNYPRIPIIDAIVSYIPLRERMLIYWSRWLCPYPLKSSEVRHSILCPQSQTSCICGDPLIRTSVRERLEPLYHTTKTALSLSINCNQCYKRCKNDDIIFYCDASKSIHSGGYDLCSDCVVQPAQSSSHRNLTALKNMGFTGDEALKALRKHNSDYAKAKRYLTEQKQRAIETVIEANQYFDSEQFLQTDYFEQRTNNEDSLCMITTEDCDIQHCTYVTQLVHALNGQHTPPFLQALLDAFMHVIECHDKDVDFEYILCQLNSDECDYAKCDMFHRHYRNRTRNNVYKYLDVTDMILDKIHCYYLHSYDMRLRVRKTHRHKASLITKSTASESVKSRKVNQINMDPSGFSPYRSYYSFGKQFEYNESDYNANKENAIKPLFVEAPKYSSLKDELTNNSFCSLNIEQFDAEYKKAVLLLGSFYCKRKYSDLLMDHVLSLMIYSNYDVLQNIFSSTYRKVDDEADSDLIKRHKHFYFMARNIKYAVNTCGDVSKMNLYHGIEGKLRFPAYLMNVVIKSPLSATSCFTVATSFATNGLIVQFEPTSSSNTSRNSAQTAHACRALSLAWLSDFSNEKEYLFIQCNGVFNIQNIFDPDNNSQYQIILKALRYIDDPQPLKLGIYSDEKEDQMKARMQLLVERILHHQIAIRGIRKDLKSFNYLDGLAQHMIDTYCNNKTYCEVSYADPIYKTCRMVGKQWMDMKLIQMIFRNLQIIHLRHVNLSQHSLDYLYEMLKLSLSLKLVWIKPKKASDWSIVRAIDEYKHKFENVGFLMERVTNEDIGYAKQSDDDICYYLSIQKIGAIPKYIVGNEISNKSPFGKCIYANYNKETNLSTEVRSIRRRVWCLK
eukprot:408287_1